MKGLGARHHLKYNRIKDFPLRAWSRQPMICRAQPKFGSSYTRHERPGSPSPVEIQRNQGYSIMAAWSRQLMICRAQPKLGFSYTRHERPRSPSPVEIQRNQGYSIMAAWPRQLMICRAQPKLGSSYTRNERLESPSPSPSPSQFLAGQLSVETTLVNY